MEIKKAVEKKKTKNRSQQKKENNPKLNRLSPYLCDLCDFRRNKDNPDGKGFKCNTDKRKSVRYKGCQDFGLDGRKADAFTRKTKKTVAGPETKKEK